MLLQLLKGKVGSRQRSLLDSGIESLKTDEFQAALEFTNQDMCIKLGPLISLGFSDADF
jgi:hypothetical protein